MSEWQGLNKAFSAICLNTSEIKSNSKNRSHYWLKRYVDIASPAGDLMIDKKDHLSKFQPNDVCFTLIIVIFYKGG